MSIIYHVLLLNLWDPTPKSLGSNSKTFKISTPPPYPKISCPHRMAFRKATKFSSSPYLVVDSSKNLEFFLQSSTKVLNGPVKVFSEMYPFVGRFDCY